MRNKPVSWGPSPHMTAPPYINGRPMSSHEIQTILNRSPTREERSRFGTWRSNNPNIDLATGEEKKPEPYIDGDRYMPRSWHIMRELEELLPGRSDRICELIEQLIEAKIAER